MYSSTINKEFDPSLSLIVFADDHAIVNKFNPNLPIEEIYVIDLLFNNLDNIKTWMNSIRLKMNISKSEFIIFGNSIQASKCITRGLNIEGDTVCRLQLFRYLEAWLDSELTLKTFVKKCATGMLNLQRTKNVLQYLTVESCTKLW